MQIRIPQSSSLWPSMAPPKKRTEERSGNFRFASPPASLAGRAMARAAATSANNPAAATFTDRCKTSEIQLDQAFCSQVRMNASSKIRVDNELRAGAGQPALLHTSHGRNLRVFAYFAGASP